MAALALASSLLAACGGDSGKPELVWYINPDSGGQDAVAEKCSTDDYTISTQVLPQDAGQQRIQLARRLAAKDPSIDLMSIDPPFTAEFADAGFLAEVPQDAKAKLEEQGTFKGAMDAATWKDKLVVFPFWSNTQVLWYRKSFVEKAGLDMSQPVTWDQIIDAASENDGKIGVQANKYEGYVVWINALVEGAGGHILEDAERGRRREDHARRRGRPGRRGHHREARHLRRRTGRPERVQRGHRRIDLRLRPGLVPGQLDLHLAQLRRHRARRRQGHRLRPLPADRRGRGVPPAVRRDRHRRQRLLRREGDGPRGRAVPRRPGEPGHQRRADRQHAGQHAGYDYPKLKEQYPADLLELFQASVDAAAPRTVSPYWSDVSGSIQNIWHPPRGVDTDTPERSSVFIEDVLKGGDLL